MMRNKNGLDEMQLEQHRRIGNQMFEILSFALLFNIALYGAGIHWLAYPTDVMVIVLACFGIYLVRLILAGAYQDSSALKPKAAVIIAAMGIAFAAVYAIMLWKRPANMVQNTDDYGAYILVGISVAGLLATGIASAIRKKRDKDEADD